MDQLHIVSEKRLKSVAVILMTAVIALTVLGCSNSNASSSSAKQDNGEPEFIEEAFYDIIFEIPGDLTGGPASDNTALYHLDERSKNPFALTIHLQCDPAVDATAASWYEAFNEVEACELVTANGIEMCFVSEDPSQKVESSAAYFAYNGAFYSMRVDCSLDSIAEYEEYVQRFYETIKGKDGTTAGESAGSASKDAQLSDGIPAGAIGWSQADRYIGQTATFYGSVVDTEYASSSNGHPTFLDLGVAYPDANRLSIVIWGKDKSAFSTAPENLYEGKTIAVTGEVYVYNGVCNIEVSSPSQITVLD